MQKRTDNFNKFSEKKKGSAVKEAIRQEKRKVKADARAAGEEMRAMKKAKARGEIIEPKKVEGRKVQGRGVKAEGRNIGAKILKPDGRKVEGGKIKVEGSKVEATTKDSIIPLNKFVAHAGICGRREAAELVKEGKVTVNGDKVFEPGYKVSQADKITVKGKEIFLQKNNVYILLNKP
ncbi:MAG: rRNA pseudouridine synthase, partial [Sphingobacteriia bacterium]